LNFDFKIQNLNRPIEYFHFSAFLDYFKKPKLFAS